MAVWIRSRTRGPERQHQRSSSGSKPSQRVVAGGYGTSLIQPAFFSLPLRSAWVHGVGEAEEAIARISLSARLDPAAGGCRQDPAPQRADRPGTHALGSERVFKHGRPPSPARPRARPRVVQQSVGRLAGYVAGPGAREPRRGETAPPEDAHVDYPPILGGLGCHEPGAPHVFTRMARSGTRATGQARVIPCGSHLEIQADIKRGG